MNKHIYFLTFFLVLFSFIAKSDNFQKPRQVSISGKILNFERGRTKLDFYVSRIGRNQDHVVPNIDSLGRYTAYFETYVPTDVFVTNAGFYMVVHPGDNIQMDFDGKQQNLSEILKTIKFSGDASQVNQEIALFKEKYLLNSIFYDRNAQNKAQKEYDLEKYSLYLDTFKLKTRQIYDQFVKDISPNKETKIWALTYIEAFYYDALAFYPSTHQSLNNLSPKDWDVPVSYYAPLLNRFPISRSMLISGNAINSFVNRFHFEYASLMTKKDDANKKYLNADGALSAAPGVFDKFVLNGIIKYTPDTLLRQMVLTEKFAQDFDQSQISAFENNRDLVDAYIKEPFLKEPLLQLYQQIKRRIENPQITSDAILKQLYSSSVSQIMDSVLLNNKGKVIYLDSWAIWCGPCKAEMPNSKALMKQMAGKDVSFVYICIDSNETAWKSCLDEFQLGGEHYLLSSQQSTDFRKIFELNGVPFYFLFDKQGKLVEKGSHLRPDQVKGKIETLLN